MVGNGEKIRFWEDLWMGEQPLYIQYSNLYRVTHMTNLTILVVLGHSPPSTLSLNFRCNLSNAEIERLQRLLISIGFVQLSSSPVDSRGWSFMKENEYIHSH